ncbi:DnaD/phage-associated family protein [Sinobaca qinghaiensis]|uniref:DnaD/phage-associated family protein n=1 Tax=Sinobaca qinghaiensis TaxID=342944 RepID=A0A419V584_9BACL|nr:DnaD domain protein [Sinobaca qinghaiensis]RKD73654.1 DnaD/phage-associated family protein [Sinobaca qinghaiensis]
MAYEGWIKLHRKLMEGETFQKLTAVQKLIAIYIILNANHGPSIWHDKYKNIDVKVDTGELVTSRSKIMKDWFGGDKEITEQKIRTALKKLEREGFLTIEATKYYTKLKVVNYSIFQHAESKNNLSNNHSLTNYQPKDNQLVTTNNNYKNVKNDIKLKEEETRVSPALQAWEANYGKVKPLIKESIIGWAGAFSDELVIEAIKLAVKRGGHTFIFTENILIEWKKNNITTLEEAEKYENSKQKKEQYHGKNRRNDEKVRSTYEERKSKYNFQSIGH